MASVSALQGVELHVGDALEVLPTLGEHDAIVTSPPYADAREDVESATPREYADWIEPFLVALLPRLREGGGFMLNLGRVFRDGVEQSYAEETLLRAQALGWRRIDTVVWTKINGRPVNPYLTNVHETIYWFTVGEPLAAYRGYDELRYPYPPETLLRYQRRWERSTVAKGRHEPQEGRTPHAAGARPRSVYITQVGKEKKLRHPTPMALDLARFLVCLACPPGGTVLDPFAGSGTTGVAARLHGRRAVLVERDPGFAGEAFERLAQGSLLG